MKLLAPAWKNFSRGSYVRQATNRNFFPRRLAPPTHKKQGKQPRWDRPPNVPHGTRVIPPTRTRDPASPPRSPTPSTMPPTATLGRRTGFCARPLAVMGLRGPAPPNRPLTLREPLAGRPKPSPPPLGRKSGKTPGPTNGAAPSPLFFFPFFRGDLPIKRPNRRFFYGLYF